MKKLKKICILLIVFVILFPHCIIFAATAEQVGNALATFARNYEKQKGTGRSLRILHSYDGGGNCYAHRDLGDDGYPNFTRDYNGDTVYETDCVGFVNICIAAVTGVIPDYLKVSNSCSSYVAGGGIRATDMFRQVTDGSMMPGDIGSSGSHTWIWVGGNYETVHAYSYSHTGSGNALGNSPLYQGSYDGGGIRARIRDDFAAKIDETDLVTDPTLGGRVSSDPDQLFGKNIEMSEWYYNGIPDGKYSVTKGALERIIDALKEILKFLIDIIGYIVRMVFVGWTAIIENFTTWVIESITHESALDIDATSADTNDNITIEKIVFNKVKAFNVDFFTDTAKAGD